MATTVTTNVSFQYTTPAGPPNSATASFTVASANNAQQVGVIDIPAGTLPSTTFPVAFGSIGSAKVLAIKNGTSDEIGIQLNGSPDIFRLVAGGLFLISESASPSLGPITDATIQIHVAPVTLVFVQTFVFGD